MSESWRFIELRDVDPYEYYSTLEALVSTIGRGVSSDTFLLVKPMEHVHIGAEASIKNEVKLDYCESQGIPVVRSFKPHGSSGLQKHWIIYHLLMNEVRLAVDKMITRELLLKSIIDVLKDRGISATHPAGSSNIMCRDRKMGIATIYNLWGIILINANFFIESSVDLAEMTLISTRDMRASTTTVVKEGGEMSMEGVSESMRQFFHRMNVELEDGSLSNEEETLKEKLSAKYLSESWLRYGRWSPVKDYWRPK